MVFIAILDLFIEKHRMPNNHLMRVCVASLFRQFEIFKHCIYILGNSCNVHGRSMPISDDAKILLGAGSVR